MMAEYDKLFPEYGFAKHKGYGTAAHIAALKEIGRVPFTGGVLSGILWTDGELNE